MAVFFAPSVVTPGSAGSWQDVDVSASVPSGATGVILQVIADSAQARDIGLRQNGSTDDRRRSMVDTSHSWACVGVDANRIFECWVENVAQTVRLVGYFTDDAVFLTNGVDKLPAGTTGWQDIDVSSDTGGDTAIGAVFECAVAAGTVVNFRKNGSTDNRSPNGLVSHGWFLIGLDGAEICEGNRTSTNWDQCFLTGYVTKDWTFNTNAVDRSLGSTGAYADITLSTGAIAGVIEVNSSNTQTYHLRTGGSSEDDYFELVNRVAWAIVEALSLVIEGKISATTVDFYEIGFATAPAAPAAGGPPFIRRDHPAINANLRR